MLANLLCWIMAIGLLFSGFDDQKDMYIKLLFMLAFIVAGAICKLVDAYREVNKPVDIKEKKTPFTS